jgi:hypothetical protein
MSATGRIRRAGCLLGIPVAAIVLSACGSSTKTVTTTNTVTTTATTTVPATSTNTRPPTTPSNTSTDPARSEANLTPQQKNAVRSAQDYLSLQGFSKQGLIDQLSSSAGDGYSVKDATAAVNSLNVNWNAQAARAAKSYLKLQGFSCSGLVQQLSSSAGDKFTTAQATYGAKQAGACTGGGSGSAGGGGGGGGGSGGAAAALPNVCSPGVSATPGVSCGLASNMFYEYYKAVQNGKDTTSLSVWSPATKQYYPANCSKGSGVITCGISGTTNPNAQVQITQDALDAYTPQDASRYPRNHDVGPRG